MEGGEGCEKFKGKPDDSGCGGKQDVFEEEEERLKEWDGKKKGDERERRYDEGRRKRWRVRLCLFMQHNDLDKR